MGYLSLLLQSPTALWLAAGIVLTGFILKAWQNRTANRQAIGWRTIPQPPKLFLLGNLHQIDLKKPLTSLNDIGKNYQDIFRINLPGTSLVIINSHRLYDEVCNNKRFHKEPVGGILEARNGGGDGLFTARTDEEAWGIAHRILSPEFSQRDVKKYFKEMLVNTNLLMQKWQSSPDGYVFEPYPEFGKLSFDIISKSAFSLDLGAVQNDEIPRFAHAITDFFSESGQRAVRPSVVNRYVFWRRNRYYWKCIDEFQSCIWKIIGARTNGSSKQKQDVLQTMMTSCDPSTEKMMTEENCMYNTLALVGAGYETVASMFSFLLISLLQHPHCLKKLQEEITKELGDRPMTENDLANLPYLTACIHETLRLYPSAPAHSLKLREEAITPEDPGLGSEQYRVDRKDIVRVNLMAVQRDPLVYGANADEFVPERMMGDSLASLPRNAWKPFGTGTRICLGRYFALQEAHVVMTTLLQNFDFEFVDDRCDYEIGETLILRPYNCTVKAIPKMSRQKD